MWLVFLSGCASILKFYFSGPMDHQAKRDDKNHEMAFEITLIKKPYQIGHFFDPQFARVPVQSFYWSYSMISRFLSSQRVCWALIWIISGFEIYLWKSMNIFTSDFSGNLWILFNSLRSYRSFVRLIVRLTDFPDFHTGTFSVAFRTTETRFLSERKGMSSN